MSRTYYLDYALTFDRPEKRDATYSFRPAPHTTFAERSYVGESQKSAVRAFEAKVAGEFDSPSEYVSRVALVSVDAFGQNRRTVRTDVYRVRDSGEEHAVRVETEREQFERRMAAQHEDAGRAA